MNPDKIKAKIRIIFNLLSILPFITENNQEKTYEDLFSKGEKPENLDKEIFRSWLMETFPEIFPDITPEQQIPEIHRQNSCRK